MNAGDGDGGTGGGGGAASKFLRNNFECGLDGCRIIE